MFSLHSLLAVVALASSLANGQEGKFKAREYSLGGNPPNLTGVLEENFILTEAEKYKINQLEGPESFVFHNGHVYTGLADGRIVDISDCGVKLVAHMTVEGCNGSEDKCGRPLGMRMDKQGRLVVADAARGLFRIDLVTGEIETLFDSKTTMVAGKPCKFINDVAISGDGTIFFTDSSSKWSRDKYLYAVLEGDNSGRLLAYSDAQNKTIEVQKGLMFPNGLQLADDDSFILISETTRARILKLHLTPDARWRKLTLFAGNLPGLPDNIRVSPRGTYWVAMSQVRHDNMTSLVDDYASQPQMRNYAVMMSTYDQLVDMSPKYGMVLELDANGNILRSLQDPTGQSLSRISEAHEYHGYLYLGTFDGINVNRVRIETRLNVDGFIDRIKSTCRKGRMNLERLRNILKRLVAIAEFRRLLIKGKQKTTTTTQTPTPVQTSPVPSSSGASSSSSSSSSGAASPTSSSSSSPSSSLPTNRPSSTSTKVPASSSTNRPSSSPAARPASTSTKVPASTSTKVPASTSTSRRTPPPATTSTSRPTQYIPQKPTCSAGQVLVEECRFMEAHFDNTGQQMALPNNGAAGCQLTCSNMADCAAYTMTSSQCVLFSNYDLSGSSLTGGIKVCSEQCRFPPTSPTPTRRPTTPRPRPTTPKPTTRRPTTPAPTTPRPTTRRPTTRPTTPRRTTPRMTTYPTTPPTTTTPLPFTCGADEIKVQECPMGWIGVESSGLCYKFFGDKPAGFREAALRCNSFSTTPGRGGVAEPRTSEINEIVEMLKNGFVSWVGMIHYPLANDLYLQDGAVQTGYLNWERDEPKTLRSGPHCVKMSEGKWKTAKCEEVQAYVCEIPPQDVCKWQPARQPSQPVQPNQPMQPTQPNQPSQPMQPVQPVRPVQPVQPVTRAPTFIETTTTPRPTTTFPQCPLGQEGVFACPSGWYMDSHCYAFFESKVNQKTASNYCASMGSHLAMPREYQDQRFLVSGMGVSNIQLWIGVAYDSQVRRWMWDDKTEFLGKYSAWNTNQQGPMSNKNCVFSSNVASELGWNRANCEDLRSFVCETDAKYMCQFEATSPRPTSNVNQGRPASNQGGSPTNQSPVRPSPSATSPPQTTTTPRRAPQTTKARATVATTPTTTTPPQCPTGQQLMLGCEDSSWSMNPQTNMCMKYNDTLFHFLDGIAKCKEDNARMVLTKTDTESKYAMNLHTAQSRCSATQPNDPYCQFWLGIRFIQNQHYWNDITPLGNGYSLWSMDTPSDPTGLDCVTSGPGMWNMVDCDQAKATLMCEKPAVIACRAT